MVFQDLMIGIVGGVVASGFTWFLLQVLNKIILPWYQSVIYQGHLIGGEWRGFFLIGPKLSKPKIPNCSIFIKQSGYMISGDLFLTRHPSGEKCEKHFSLAGSFREDDLILNFEAKDKTKFGRGTFVMQLLHDGGLLNGYYTHFEAMHDTIETDPVIWEKSLDHRD